VYLIRRGRTGRGQPPPFCFAKSKQRGPTADFLRCAKENTAGAKCFAVTNSTTATNLSQADLVCDSLEQIDLDMIQELIDSA